MKVRLPNFKQWEKWFWGHPLWIKLVRWAQNRSFPGFFGVSIYNVAKAPLSGPGCHLGAVMAAIDFVVPAVEIIDSRYRDFKFDLKSVIADNTSASRFVVGGRPRNLDELDLRTLGVVMEKNGGIVAMAAGAAVLGHPLAAVVMLANHLGARGQEIPAGTFIMTGGVTEAIAVQAGDNVAVRFQDLGTVSMRFV